MPPETGRLAGVLAGFSRPHSRPLFVPIETEPRYGDQRACADGTAYVRRQPGSDTISSEKPCTREVSGGVWTIDLSPDGSMLAASINGTAIVWTTADGREVARFPAPRSQQITLVPDRSLLLGRSDDGVIDVWDLAGRRPLGTMVIPDPAAAGWQATNLSLTAPGRNGTVYVVAQRSGRLLSLDMDPSRWLAEVCSRAGRRLTTDEWLEIIGERPAETHGC